MKTLLYNPIFINPQAYYVFPRLTRYLQPDNESTSEPANYIGTIEVKVIAYGDTTLKRTYTNTDSIDLSEFKNTWIRISLFTKVGSCVLGEWKIGNMESDLPYIDPEVLASLKAVVIVGNKTNNDSDRAIVKNLVDPDNPFVISNAAYTEGSGYADKGSPYYGAFVTDGIDDLIASTKTVQEMLGGSNEFTVVSMMANLDSVQMMCNSNYNNTNGYNPRNTLEPNGVISMLGYTDKNGTTNNLNLIMGDKDSIKLVDKVNFNSDYVFYPAQYYGAYYKAAWYWTVIANKVLTTDQINQVIAYFNLDRTLKPDMLCNITKQGITNDNHADFNDKLIDYSGNGRDIQMYNLAWKGGSGIAAKKFETIKDYNIIPDEGLQELTIYNEFSFKIKSIRHADRYWAVQSLNKTDMSYPVTIITDKDIIWRNTLNYTDADGVKGNVKKETNVPANTPTQVFIYGFNDFDISDDYTKVNCVAYATRKDITEFTVTFIPSCKGGLLLDGVNDFGQFVGDLGLKDYTLIMNRAYNNLINNQVPLISSNIVEDQTPFIVEHWNTGSNAISFSYGASRTTDIPLDINKKIVYQSTYSYMGYVIPKGNAISTGNGITLGKFGNGVQYSAICLWSLMLFPYSMSEFLIERQLKKYKLGTLYPDMVEFRPVIKANDNYKIFYTAMLPLTGDIWERINIGDYVPVGRRIAIQMSFDNEAKKLVSAVSSQLGNITIVKNSNNIGYTIFGDVLKDKSPQKISITIEQDENYVLFNPVINSNYKYISLDFFLNNYQKKINIGDYIPKDAYLRANLYLNNNVDEPAEFTFNGVSIGYSRSITVDTAFNIGHIYNYDSPQEVNITIDEYIRYEDIVQPYPVLLRFNDENGNEVSWGGKFKVGSTITRIGSIADPESNLLNGLYSISGLSLNGKSVTSSTSIVEKQMVFKTTTTYLLDNNEPKCILSPSRLRIPNSSYKILGYIPDISGHGNHGVIHNSAYAGASGANGYLQNFSGWTKASGVSSTDSVISSSNNLVAANGWIAYVTSGTVIPTFKVEISGIPINSNLRFEGSGQTLVNGVNTIQGLTTTKISGFYISNGYDNDWSNLRIEQVGEYEGAYCLDGVDDFVTIPTLSSGGKQVLMKVNLPRLNEIIYDQRKETNTYTFAILTTPSQIAYDQRNSERITYIDGILNTNIIAEQLMGVTHNIVVINSKANLDNTRSPILGRDINGNNWSRMRIYDFMLFDNVSTDDKIKQLNEYVGIEGNTE